jgi:malonyl CoA-acyl carrier protein transacylase/predicted hotdog family 3-hydroxylacyl-ACP dehydratase
MMRTWPTELCLVHAPSRADLVARLDALGRELSADAGLVDVARDLNRDWTPDASCLAVVASATDELRRKLAHAAGRLRDPKRMRIQDRSGIFFFEERLGRAGGTTFLFPGEGAQYPGMLQDVCAAFPEARQAFDLADRACADAGFAPSALVFPPPGREAAADDALWGMEAAVEAVVGAGTALMRVFDRLAIRPDAVVGHSSGELLAVEQAGVVQYADDGARVEGLRNGYRLMQALARTDGIPEGILLTVGGPDRPAIEAHLARHGDALRIAMDNCPHQVVLCAAPAVADGVEQALMDEGAIVVRLPFARPYHTAWFEPALEAVRAYFRTFALRPPRIPFYSCATAGRFPDDPDGVRELCVEQWARPVRFQETIERLYADGIRVFVEIGPRGNLTAFTDDILKTRPHLAVASNKTTRPGLDQLNRALGLLAAHGVPMDPRALHAHRPAPPAAFVSARALRLAQPMPRLALDAGAASAIPPHAASAALPDLGAFPLLGEAVAGEPGSRLECLSVIDCADAAWIHDHAIGTSAVAVFDPALRGYPVMPFPGTLELAAETAAALVPGKVVSGFENAEAREWIRFDRGRRTLRTIANLRAAGPETRVHVAVRAADADGDPAEYNLLLAETLVVLADAYPEPAEPEAPAWTGEKPAGWSGAQIYPLRLFHGPRLQALAEITRWADDGLAGRLRVQPRSGWFRSTSEPTLCFDPVLLDGLSQALGVWGTYTPMTGLVAFPLSARTVRFHAPPPEAGTELTFTIHVRESRARSVRADFTARDAAGRVVISAVDWRDAVFDVTAPLHAATQAPLERMMSLFPPVPAGLPAGAVCAVTPADSARLLATGHPIWGDILRTVSLSATERTQWPALPADRAARMGWLAGRVAVKDAVRRFLMRRDGLRAAGADVIVRAAPDGGLTADGAWGAAASGPVAVALRTADGRAAAVAAPDLDGLAIAPLLDSLLAAPDDTMQNPRASEQTA